MTHPISPGDLICDGCHARYPDAGTETAERARARGWHVYRGASVTGEPLSKNLCERCTGNTGPRRPGRDAVMQDQMDLFGGDI